MESRTVRRFALMLIVLGPVVLWWTGAARGADRAKPLPTWAEVEEVVLRHFGLLPDYRPGDILARSEVRPLFSHLERMGWEVSDRPEILRQVPADDHYLIRKLRTKRGRKFMRRIAEYPRAYDRLDRLSRLPYGKQTVHDLIYKKGGEELIEYLTTASGGKELGKMLSKAPKGTDFNKPTGLIYTAQMLLERLKTSYAAAKEAAQGKKAAKRQANRVAGAAKGS